MKSHKRGHKTFNISNSIRTHCITCITRILNLKSFMVTKRPLLPIRTSQQLGSNLIGKESFNSSIHNYIV